MRDLHDGRLDGLHPLTSIDLDEVHSFSDLLEGMSHTAFGGRQLGRALDVTTSMVQDPECLVVLTISGAMTIAKMGKVICKMIDLGMVQAVVATGALITHGLSEAIGLAHYAYDPSKNDDELYEKGYNRVYDTLEMEQNLNDVEQVTSKVLESIPDDEVLCSTRICSAIGKYLADNTKDPGILRSAYLKNVPVYIPAFTDCELGLDVCCWILKRRTKGRKCDGYDEAFNYVPNYNPFLDLQHYSKLFGSKPRHGIFTIGGGVPRNWAQQVGPYYELLAYRLGFEHRDVRFNYGVRICPEPDHWGGLSGCSYSEGISWGKFVPPAEGGKYAEVPCDATVVWPLLIRAVMEKLGQAPPPRKA